MMSGLHLLCSSSLSLSLSYTLSDQRSYRFYVNKCWRSFVSLRRKRYLLLLEIEVDDLGGVWRGGEGKDCSASCVRIIHSEFLRWIIKDHGS